MTDISYAVSSHDRPSVMRVGKNYMHDLIDGNARYPGDYPGVTYYVNNITGSSTNDGLTWNKAFDQISAAVTASEAQRALASGTTNDYQRNIIYVQGTGTTYTYITALPSYADVIGIGANPRGDGAGIVVLGSTGAYDGAAGAMRGTNWANIQFITGNGSTSAFHASVAYRSSFVNCTFGTGTGAAAAPLSGLDCDSASGLVVSNCAIVANQSLPVTGMAFGSGGSTGNFSQCLIEDCMISGSTAGMTVGAYLCNWTIVRNNVIYGATYGVQDISTESNILANVLYTGNFVSSADAFAVTNNAIARVIGNHVVNGTTAGFEAEFGSST